MRITILIELSEGPTGKWWHESIEENDRKHVVGVIKNSDFYTLVNEIFKKLPSKEEQISKKDLWNLLRWYFMKVC